MKSIFLTIFLIIFSSNSFAQDKWTKEDTYREIVAEVVHLIDWSQTLYISKHPGYYERTNILLGKNPSTKKVNALMATWSILHPYIAYELPKEYRESWQYIWIGFKTGLIFNNYRIGIKLHF